MNIPGLSSLALAGLMSLSVSGCSGIGDGGGEAASEERGAKEKKRRKKTGKKKKGKKKGKKKRARKPPVFMLPASEVTRAGKRKRVPPMLRFNHRGWAKATKNVTTKPAALAELPGVLEVLPVARGQWGQLVVAPRCRTSDPEITCIPRVSPLKPGGWSFDGCNCVRVGDKEAAKEFRVLECRPVLRDGAYACECIDEEKNCKPTLSDGRLGCAC